MSWLGNVGGFVNSRNMVYHCVHYRYNYIKRYLKQRFFCLFMGSQWHRTEKKRTNACNRIRMVSQMDGQINRPRTMAEIKCRYLMISRCSEWGSCWGFETTGGWRCREQILIKSTWIIPNYTRLLFWYISHPTVCIHNWLDFVDFVLSWEWDFLFY